ncbi:MAG: alpha/beta fold hydrolase [Bacteroidia bacterium]|jgi:pimeloyl-ACP methyl ester carboxylesterase
MKQLLLLHGALASKNQFDPFIPLLKDQFEADAINFSGHGGFSIPSHGYTFKQFATDILKYADDKKIEKINLFGFSMGGYAALYFARQYPDRVNKIFTLNVKFNWDPTSTAKETALLDADKMITKVPGYANQLMMQHGMNMWKQVLQQTSDMMTTLSKELVLTDEDFKAINMPVLLAIGDRDNTSSIEETLHVYRNLKQAQMWVLPGTPHPLDRINTGDLVKAIHSFF